MILKVISVLYVGVLIVNMHHSCYRNVNVNNASSHIMHLEIWLIEHQWQMYTARFQSWSHSRVHVATIIVSMLMYERSLYQSQQTIT